MKGRSELWVDRWSYLKERLRILQGRQRGSMHCWWVRSFLERPNQNLLRHTRGTKRLHHSSTVQSSATKHLPMDHGQASFRWPEPKSSYGDTYEKKCENRLLSKRLGLWIRSFSHEDSNQNLLRHREEQCGVITLQCPKELVLTFWDLVAFANRSA